mgnify:CR=1 FL=1
MLQLPENPVLRAGLFMVLAMGCFVTNDTCVKMVGQSLPVGEIVAIRGFMSSLLIMAICARQGVLGHWPLILTAPVMSRAALDLVGTLLFITALMHMHIANLTAILQAVPLAVAFFSALFLGERVGIRRWSAIVIGFIGVLMIVKPSPESFTIYEVFALTIVFSLACRDIITRRIPARIPTLIIALANAAFVTLGGVALGLVEGFVAPQAWQLGLLALASLFLGAGYVFMVATLRIGDLSATAPFRYSILIFAIISGVAVFQEIPDGIAVLGMILIVATGLYAAHRESVVKGIAKTRAP